MKEIILVLIILLLYFSGMAGWIFTSKVIDRIEIKNKIRIGACPIMDQYGNCWTAKEYQDYLNYLTREVELEIPEEIRELKSSSEELLRLFRMW